MARSLFRGAPELSRLFAEAPFELFCEFIAPPRFADLLPPTISEALGERDEQARRDAVQNAIGLLAADRVALVEKEARDVTAMSDTKPDIVLMRLGDDIRYRAEAGLSAQRDPLARSLWAYLRAGSLFRSAQRALQVDVYREHGKIYERWSVGADIALDAAGIDKDTLESEISARLNREDGCKVEAVDLPPAEGREREVLLAVTFFGAHSSQKTVRPDRTTSILYFRPPDEMLLVYSPRRRCIEICARDPVERRIVANIFAEETLRHDISNKPLTQKTYNLSRFRTSLKLEVPESEAHRVRRACLTEVQVALGEWSKRVSLTVTPDDDIDAIAREVFGAITTRSGKGYVTKVHFHIEHTNENGTSSTLRFDVYGRNRSSIQSQRDPAKRALGYDLLEAWGVLERVGDLTAAQRREKLPQLLAIYDLPDATVTGQFLDELGIDVTELSHAGYMIRKGWSQVILFEDEELGDVLHQVEGGNTDLQLTLRLAGGGPRRRINADDIAQFEIRFEYVRDSLRDVMKPLGLTGRLREVSEHIHQLGVTKIGLADTPVFLARGLADDSVLEKVDRLVRGEHSLTRGIVFVPRDVRFPYLGSHVVLSVRDHLNDDGQIDFDTVRVAYEASVDPASKGAGVHFRKQGNDAGQITVPGQLPLIVTGAKKVLLFERLYVAYCSREPGVKLSVLKAYAGFSQLPQLFGQEHWPGIKDRYIHSPRHAHWALCDTPISV